MQVRNALALVCTVAIAFALMPSSAALAATETRPIVFPVAGPNHYSDTFGAPRSGGRTHEGIDIMSDKMTPIIAAADGTVGWMQDEQGGNCCAMALNHDDGWASWYIHMNNDTPGTDDGQGWGFAPGITSGVHVNAGQLIGWVGDSGNAEWTASHLHFELHMPDGTPINPYPSLVAAESGSSPRLAGESRYGTAAKVALAGFPNGADDVFIAVGTGFADALAVAPVAAMTPAPVLLVASSYIPSATAERLGQLAPSRITILGGTGAVSADVEQQLAASTGATVTRVAGIDRYETAARIAETYFGSVVDTVFIASGTNYPDALAGAVAAAKLRAPLLLADRLLLPTVTKNELRRLNPRRIIILGGVASISSDVEAALAFYAPQIDRVAGGNRYETAAAISRQFFSANATRVYVATGEDFADALAAAPLAGMVGAPILLVSDDGVLPMATLDELRRMASAMPIIVGGQAAVNQWVDVTLFGLR